MSDLSKHQYNKLMKRPSKSEYDDVIRRDNKRAQKLLESQQHQVNKLAQVHLNDHYNKKKNFIDSQLCKLAAISKQRRRSDESDIKTDSFQKLSVLNPLSRRGSLPVSTLSHPLHNWSNRDNSYVIRRRRSMPDRKMWEDLSASKWSNRTLEIRHKLYDEFKVAKSPNNTLQLHKNHEERRQKFWEPSNFNTVHRRLSEPASGMPLSDYLSPVLEKRFSMIFGENLPGGIMSIENTAKEIDDQVGEVSDVPKEEYVANSSDINPNNIFGDHETRPSNGRFSDVQRIADSSVLVPKIPKATSKARRHSESMLPIKLPSLVENKLPHLMPSSVKLVQTSPLSEIPPKS